MEEKHATAALAARERWLSGGGAGGGAPRRREPRRTHTRLEVTPSTAPVVAILLQTWQSWSARHEAVDQTVTSGAVTPSRTTRRHAAASRGEAASASAGIVSRTAHSASASAARSATSARGRVRRPTTDGRETEGPNAAAVCCQPPNGHRVPTRRRGKLPDACCQLRAGIRLIDEVPEHDETKRNKTKAKAKTKTKRKVTLRNLSGPRRGGRVQRSTSRMPDCVTRHVGMATCSAPRRTLPSSSCQASYCGVVMQSCDMIIVPRRRAQALRSRAALRRRPSRAARRRSPRR